MKRTKNIIPLFLAALLMMAFFNSCVKSRSGATDFGSLTPFMTIPEGGLNNFGASGLGRFVDASDTAWFHVNYAATTVAPHDIVVTLGVDNDAMAIYNADPTHVVKFVILPDSAFSFTTTTITVRAGQSYSDAVGVVILPGKIDPTTSYMLPISITDAQGVNISANFGTIYFNKIGNPLAGAYTWDFTRWQSFDTTTAPQGSSFTGHTTIAAAVDATTIYLPEGYLQTAVTGAAYSTYLAFTYNAPVLSNFVPSFDALTLSASGIGPGSGFTIVSGPVLDKAIVAGTPANNFRGTVFRIRGQVINPTGGDRTFIDNFTKQ